MCRSVALPCQLARRLVHIQNRNAVFAAQSHPQLFSVAREGRLVRLAEQDAARQALGVGGGTSLWVGDIAEHAPVDRINQINVAAAAA